MNHRRRLQIDPDLTAGWIVMCNERRGTKTMMPLALTGFRGETVLMIRSFATVFGTRDDAMYALKHVAAVAKKHDCPQWIARWRKFDLLPVARPGDDPCREEAIDAV